MKMNGSLNSNGCSCALTWEAMRKRAVRRTIAQMRYPYLEEDSIIVSSRIRGKYAVSYRIVTATIWRNVEPRRLFDTEIKATYSAIKDIIEYSHDLLKDERDFLWRLCDQAFDAVNPTLF